MARKAESRDPITGEYYPAGEPHVNGQPHRGDTITLRADQARVAAIAPLAPADAQLLHLGLKEHFLAAMNGAAERHVDVTRAQIIDALVEAARVGSIHPRPTGKGSCRIFHARIKPGKLFPRLSQGGAPAIASSTRLAYGVSCETNRGASCR